MPKTPPERILVTGASGYIAIQLIPFLLEKGYRVRCLIRDVDHLKYRSWVSQVEIVIGDLTKPETIKPALKDISQAYYLVHSMASGDHYTDRDLLAARDAMLATASATSHGAGAVRIGSVAHEVGVSPGLIGEGLRSCASS